jgi:hypothetical protein
MSVSSHTITVQNRLEVRPGNVILVPGCEPTSAFTSPTLAANQDCSGSIVTLAAVLANIPGAKVTQLYNGGGAHTKMYVILPSGPAPSPNRCNAPGTSTPACIPDWYAIIKELAEPITSDDEEESQTVEQICERYSIQTRCGIL